MVREGVFNITTFKVSQLVTKIETGDIALPELQRPFVWENTKVRNLIDSLYKGLPTGLLILWEVGIVEDDFKQIGSDKPSHPTSLIIDGQQRLTSLYAVLTGDYVIDKKFNKKQIKISFNPMTEEIAGLDSSKERDPEWINNITDIFKNKYQVINNYINTLKEKKPDLPLDEQKIIDNIEELEDIIHYQFSVVQLSHNLTPEEVSEIFVRINSQGKTLNQSDFILTLMSVYWDEGRKALETFSKECEKPSMDSSPFNRIKATPDDKNLLRVGISYAFLRGRLKYAYSILKGRNLELQETTPEERIKNFDIFKDAQEDVLNLVNWHAFIDIVAEIGFVHYKLLISSELGFYATYAFYLIGKYKFNVKHDELKRVIQKWFVFTQLTQRYSNSAESKLEKDLAPFREDNANFVEILNNIMNSELHEDYWNITLPEKLISSKFNYAGNVYVASKIFQDTKVLFSNDKIGPNLDPLIKSTKNSVDKHHIFPKNYLIGLGYGQTEYNQQANYIYLKYQDNIKISDRAPEEYWFMMLGSLNSDEREYIEQHYTDIFDLPHEFWKMNYPDFLKARRELMAKSIKNYFKKL